MILCWGAASSATQEFPTIYGTWRIITLFTRALRQTLSRTKSVQFIPPDHTSDFLLYYLPTSVLVVVVVSVLPAFQPIFYMHSSSPHSCCMPRLPRPPWLGHSNSKYTSRGIQVMKLFVMQFSLSACHFTSLALIFFSATYSQIRPVCVAPLKFQSDTDDKCCIKEKRQMER
jgi:hypothetical protein